MKITSTAKAILSRYGVTTPRGEVVSPEKAREAAHRLRSHVNVWS